MRQIDRSERERESTIETENGERESAIDRKREREGGRGRERAIETDNGEREIVRQIYIYR